MVNPNYKQNYLEEYKRRFSSKLTNDLEVKLHKLGFNDTLISITLDTTLIDKEDGLFAVDNNIIYRAITNTIPNFLSDNYRYALTIKNKKSGNQVNCNTKVISNFSFIQFNSVYKFVFYMPSQPDSSKFKSKTLHWGEVSNGVIYQLGIKFNYLENGELKSLVWNQPLVSFTGIQMSTKLEGIKFFNYLINNLEDDVTVTREFINLDVIMMLHVK